MKCQIDGPIAQLILDLEKTGHLDRTLVIRASEFSRDMMVEGRPELMFGGGVKKGWMYGKTAAERPCKTIETPIRIDGFHQTIYHAPGIDPDTQYEVEKRPFYTTPTAKAKQ